jgi:hypothetical protein
MPRLLDQLELGRCPHCNVDSPSLNNTAIFRTIDNSGKFERHWRVYVCKRCGGAVTAWSFTETGEVGGVFPTASDIAPEIPDPARSYLRQALDSRHAPAGAVILAASAIDSMLKLKGYREGSLFHRIDQAESDHLITAEMARWAHNVRLDANEPRHADESAPLPTQADAERSIDFAQALAEFLFVLPARVSRGIADAQPDSGAA